MDRPHRQASPRYRSVAGPIRRFLCEKRGVGGGGRVSLEAVRERPLRWLRWSRGGCLGRVWNTSGGQGVVRGPFTGSRSLNNEHRRRNADTLAAVVNGRLRPVCTASCAGWAVGITKASG